VQLLCRVDMSHEPGRACLPYGALLAAMQRLAAAYHPAGPEGPRMTPTGFASGDGGV